MERKKENLIEYIKNDVSNLADNIKTFIAEQKKASEERAVKEEAELDRQIETLKKKSIIARKKQYIKKLEDDINGNNDHPKRTRIAVYGSSKPALDMNFKPVSPLELNRRANQRFKKSGFF